MIVFRKFVLIGMLLFWSNSPVNADQTNGDDLFEFVQEALSEIDDGNFHLFELKLLSDAKKTVIVKGNESVTAGSKEIGKFLRASLPANQKTFHQISNIMMRDYKDPGTHHLVSREFLSTRVLGSTSFCAKSVRYRCVQPFFGSSTTTSMIRQGSQVRSNAVDDRR
ncbi:MAG: hypothetical protein NTV34_11670 [Proteobacteria bacterium]|nr:hypothetical protein [Pseudomonadota bacterium]